MWKFVECLNSCGDRTLHFRIERYRFIVKLFVCNWHGVVDTSSVSMLEMVKVKVTLVQALRLCRGRTAHRGSRGIALSFHDHSSRKGSASRPGRSLPPGKTRYPFYRRLGEP